MVTTLILGESMLKIRLKEVLDHYGYTLYDLSDAILDLEGISESTVYRFARGEQNLTLKKLELILSAVRSLTGRPIRLHDLVGDEAFGDEAFGDEATIDETLPTPSLTDEPGFIAEPVSETQQSNADLVLFSQGKTAEDVEDVWDLITLAQRPNRRPPKSPARRWLLGLGGLSLVGLALLAVSLAPGGTQVAALLASPLDLTPREQTIQVSQGVDDAEQALVSGRVYRDSNDLELVDDGAQNGHQVVGIRFQDVKLSPGTTVDAVYIEFKADASDSGPASLTIRGEASDFPDVFRNLEGNITGRPVTAAVVNWLELAPWEAGQTYRTPNLAPIVQELIDRNGWTSGNSVVFIVTGTGKRTAESFESKPTDAPLLRVEFTR